MRRLLIVHYHFLPVYNVSTRRLLGYARHLPAFGWQPRVLTRVWRDLEDADPSWGLAWEPHIEEALGIAIHRAPAGSPRRPRPRPGRAVGRAGGGRQPGRKLVAKAERMFTLLPGRYPDEFVAWQRPAAAVGERVVRDQGVDLVVSYCPPETNHAVARRIARGCGVPWVPFFGDLYGFLDPPLPRHSLEGFVRRAWHRWCLAPAAACIGVSPAMVDYLARTYRRPSHLIHTGYDPEDFAGPLPDGAASRDRFVLSHVGSIYPGDQRPEILLDGLDLLLARHPELARRLEVRFVGSKCDDALRSLLGQRPAARICRIEPRVDPVTALSRVRSSDALLAFTCTAHRDRHGTLSYPTKVFEAFGARRPILAVPADGDWVDALLAETGAGSPASDADTVATTLLAWFRAWEQEGGLPYPGRDAVLAEYTRRRQVERLAAVFDSVVSS